MGGIIDTVAGNGARAAPAERQAPAHGQRVDPQQLRGVMGAFATGVTLVTTHHRGTDFGMTVNSLTSVSLEPPLILVCLSNGTRTLGAVRGRGAFAVSILGRGHENISRHFTRPVADRFATVAFDRCVDGLPLPADRIASLQCAVASCYPEGDHTIVVGRVLRGERDHAARPLVFYSGAYTELADR